MPFEVEKIVEIPGKLYTPVKWEFLDTPLREHIAEVQKILLESLRFKQPTYEQLGRHNFSSGVNVKVRSSIAEMVKARGKRSLSMTQEITCFHKVMRERMISDNDSLYEAGAKIRYILFNKREPLRKINMGIIWHNGMVIHPPRPGDPVFLALTDLDDGPSLYKALNVYLILLTSHPYTDGNGRAARILFNRALGMGEVPPHHYIPLAELLLATWGEYEEILANACIQGDFRKLLLFLLGMLKAYAIFLKLPAADAPKSELQEVLHLFNERKNGTLRDGINNHPPYVISIANVKTYSREVDLDQNFLESLLAIARTVNQYGSIDFALTGLSDLASNIMPKSGVLSFFVKAHKKEELILNYRELRDKYRGKIKLKIVIASGEAALDAKLLLAVMSEYVSSNPDDAVCPILLNEFTSAQLMGWQHEQHDSLAS